MLFKVPAVVLMYLLGGVSAAAITNPGYVLMDTKGKSSSIPHTKNAKAVSKSSYDSISLEDLYYNYDIAIGVGTSAQSMEILIDTGSSDLWVMSSSNPDCGTTQAQINQGAPDCSTNIFNPSDSSTYSAQSTAFSIEYGDGTTASGNFFQDTLTLGSDTITAANMALATVTDSNTPVFGIGLRWTESTADSLNSEGEASPTYDNIPIQMVQQGLIKSNAYSLWLNDVNAATGSILFGAVDHSKYTGSLYKFPIVVPDGMSKPDTLSVILNSLSFNGKVVSTGALPILLDSGTSYSYVPTNLISSLAKKLGYTLNSSGFYSGKCSAVTTSDYLTFNFQGANIEAPLSDFIGTTSDSSVCDLLMIPGKADTYILGDVFLRDVYVVYDLDNLEIAMGKASYDSSSSNIDLIVSGIPSATAAPSYSATATSTVVTAH